MMKKTILAALLAVNMTLGSASAMSNPVTIADQRSFMAGGKVVTAAGNYDGRYSMDFAGETLHSEHAYILYQKPVKSHKYGLVCKVEAMRLRDR